MLDPHYSQGMRERTIVLRIPTTQEVGVRPDITKRKSFVDDLLSLWPGLRYLSLGVWLAWAFLAYSGTMWLSDVEVDGGNLSNMYIISTGSFALICLLAPFFQRPVQMILSSRRNLLCAGLLTVIGSLAIILAGPYYLAAYWLFVLGDILTGVGTAFIALKIGELYGELKPQKALVYTALSQLVIVVIYFTALGGEFYHPIEGGPSLAGIISLVLLPMIAAFLVSTCPSTPNHIEGEPDENSPEEYYREIKSLSTVFWKFLIAIFIFTTASSVINGLIVSSSPLSITLAGSNSLMLLRIVMSVLFLFFALRVVKQINFGKLYLLLMVLIAILVATSTLLESMGISFQIIIGFISNTFDFVVWCLLAFIVYQRRISSITVFGLGRGVFMVGSTLGWYLGAQLMPGLIGDNLTTVIYIVLALLILLCATLVFSERDFDRLISPITEAELTLKDLTRDLDLSSEDPTDEPRNHARPFIQACTRMGQIARLSAREQNIFELLALGRGSENIAKRLSISLNTARTHTQNVYTKLNVHSRQELIELVEDERKRQQDD
ncbi:MAG: hypothetical protein GX562_00010 [Coriobacteriaceae bacterium]|nr:hypothetical protein [Coriobacteriaceae bacterium]